MGQLDRKHAAPLLRVVRNQPYASSNDHHDDEPRMTRKGTDKRRTSRRTKAESSMPTPPGTNSSFASQKEPEPETIDLENEEDIFADPISSDDEMAVSNKAAANVKKNPLNPTKRHHPSGLVIVPEDTHYSQDIQKMHPETLVQRINERLHTAPSTATIARKQMPLICLSSCLAVTANHSSLSA